MIPWKSRKKRGSVGSSQVHRRAAPGRRVAKRLPGVQVGFGNSGVTQAPYRGQNLVQWGELV